MRVAVVAMRTAQLCETGATVRTRRLVEGLAARGHDVTVFCAQWWGGDHERFDQRGVTYRRITRTPAAGSFAAGLPVRLARHGADVVHAVASPPAAVRAARAGAWLARAPLAVDWWDDHPVDSPGAYGRIAGVPDRVFVPSRLIATRVREHGVPEAAVRLRPESIDFDLVRSAGVDRRADVVYARRLDADANVESFLLGLAELRDRGWRAAVVGDGPGREAAERTADDLRIADRVSFLGDLAPADLVPILRGAHVFAWTALDEPFATELCWALACGCVGVVEYQSGSSAHELVEGYDRGVRVTSPAELADEIAAAAGYERRTVDESFAEYDHDAVLDRTVSSYRSLIEAAGPLGTT